MDEQAVGADPGLEASKTAEVAERVPTAKAPPPAA